MQPNNRLRIREQGSMLSNNRSNSNLNNSDQKVNHLNARKTQELPGSKLKNKYAGVGSKISTGKPGSHARPPMPKPGSSSAARQEKKTQLPDFLVMPLIKSHYQRFKE